MIIYIIIYYIYNDYIYDYFKLIISKLEHILTSLRFYSTLTFNVFFFLIFIYLFFYLWLCSVFGSVQGPSPVAASGGHPSSQCVGISLLQPLLLQSTGSRHAGSVIVAHGPSCSAACGILLEQGSNPHPLHWQADSQPLRHQGSPTFNVLMSYFISFCFVSP